MTDQLEKQIAKYLCDRCLLIDSECDYPPEDRPCDGGLIPARHILALVEAQGYRWMPSGKPPMCENKYHATNVNRYAHKCFDEGCRDQLAADIAFYTERNPDQGKR